MIEQSLLTSKVTHQIVTKKDIAAHEASITMSIPELTSYLGDIVGDKTMACMLGTSETRAVRQWRAGNRQPRPPIEERLRLATRLCSIISREDRPWIARAWVEAPNPHLENKTPQDVVRSYSSNADAAQEVASNLITAARSFTEAMLQTSSRSDPNFQR